MALTHEWNLPPAEAIRLQKEIARQVRCEDDFGPVRTIAGVDVSMQRFSDDGFAAVVVLSFPELEVVEVAGARMQLQMPYIPGLLSFREVPIVAAAFEKLKTKPDLIVVDGQGRAHPRRVGIACHLGLVLDRPTIGCAKSILVGKYEDLGEEKGSTSPLIHNDEVVGYAVRTKNRVNPVFVSCGHRVGNLSAVRWVLECSRGSRLPEPTRQAHLACNAMRKAQT